MSKWDMVLAGAAVWGWLVAAYAISLAKQAHRRLNTIFVTQAGGLHTHQAAMVSQTGSDGMHAHEIRIPEGPKV